MPSAEEEIWRYSRIGDLDLDQFTPQPDRAEIDVPAPVELVVMVSSTMSMIPTCSTSSWKRSDRERCSASRPVR